MLNYLTIITLLLFCSAFFSASETALFSLSNVQLHHFRDSKKTLERMICGALEKPRKVLITILLGNELVNVLISIISASMIAKYFAKGILLETIISVIVVTPVLLILGEVVPKNLAFRFAKQFASFAILPLKTFSVVIKPIRWFLTAIADFFIRILGGSVDEPPMVMEQEYRHLIDLGKEEGVIIEEERELIHNVFEFGDKTVENIMTPASKIFSLPADLEYTELLKNVRVSGFSRIPVYESNPGNIIGILHIKDLFTYNSSLIAGGEENIRSILIKPIFVSEGLKLEALLSEFQEKRKHIALVKNSRDQIIGLVTMHDILEDLFGEMDTK